MKRKLSIVITTRNRFQLLMGCISSVLDSDYKDYEIIVIDDNSADQTKNLGSSDIDHRDVIVYHSDVKMMMVRARNKGIELSRGSNILFIDDDNIVDRSMIKHLLDFLNREPRIGISGPSMYYSDGTKYLDFQKISLITGKTTGVVSSSADEYYLSDGVPNVFIIKREVIEKVGYFDEGLIQTYTEPDYSFSARMQGYETAIYPKAVTFHQLSVADRYTLRALGGKYTQKAYCLMRNRTVIVSRYGALYQKIIYIFLFSWVWPLIYTLLLIKNETRADIVKLYWLGWYDGVIYFFTGKLRRGIK